MGRRDLARFVEAWRELDIAYDDFLRTTEPRHETTVKAFLTAIYERGHIYKGTYKGLYCVSCEDYYTEEELVDGKCPIHGRDVIQMEEDNWFFALSAFEDRLLEWYAANPDAVTPATKRNEALAFIKGGLRDISITRATLKWGIEVPWDPTQVFYVWYDALINYLTSIGYGDRRGEFSSGGRRAPPRRQGDPPLPLRVVARDVHGGGHRPAGPRPRPRLAARRRPEARQVDGRSRGAPDGHRAVDARRRLRRRRAALPPPARGPASGPTATSPSRRWRRGTTRTSRTTSATSWRG